MAILIDEKKRVLVQGITGREGRARTRLMREYGTNVVGGVTPGKGGQSVLGVPVFNTPQEAVNSLGTIDASVIFVPAAGVKDAAISAIEAGIKLAVLVPDRVPVWDAMEIAAAAKANGATFLGPNTLGALSPGKGGVGMIGGRAERAGQWGKPGVPKGGGGRRGPGDAQVLRRRCVEPRLLSLASRRSHLNHRAHRRRRGDWNSSA